ncbi:cysteine-rich receptor-like protein kinase 42 [Telopea speciosissima]|uniref:cysteine-rich receptor-like protein kinase 42 n=1 Tax=Telopea speciosissima TaxID=54955 RepID=UPI001CC764A7|nr:cysteine-rich receptor-like protein kinase 42 [Telopea speciosissima]
MNLIAPIRSQSWATLSPKPSSSSVLYALVQCFGDLSQSQCEHCFSESRNKIQQCLPSTSGRIYLNGCFLRYDEFYFFNQSSDPQIDTIKCSPTAPKITEPYLFHDFFKKVAQSFINVTEIASAHAGFGVVEAKGGVNPVFMLAQCWNTVSKAGCVVCLKSAARGLVSCLPRTEGIAMNAGCYLRYSTTKFYNDEATEIVNSSIAEVFVIIVLNMIAFLVLALVGGCLGYAKLSAKDTEFSSLLHLPAQCSLSKVLSAKKSNLNFNYETLERATDSFSPSRKLGQGGAGSVFRGDLPDGRTVAVKRLFFSTRQWVDEFFNEVNLISGINHNNLIKLLGCSIEGPESLLVYEFVPNKSLDQYLFGKNKTQILTWEQRFNIIVGTAEGLAYLHDGSEPRIIHRDIKCSNVLLDENLAAKIADFGLARHFSTDKTHLSTGIAGTMGYMAPEYLVRGQLTEKADVFSFGVLVLETVCGRRNSVFVQESGSVLLMVWNHYQSSTLPDSVDPLMRDDYPVKEACNVLQIGLLCTQASVSSRPSMSEVVQMLTNDDYMIPTPANPPFLCNSLTSNTTEF